MARFVTFEAYLMPRRYRIDRRPWRYQQWPYEIIVGGALLYLAGAMVWKAAVWVWGLF